VKDKTKHVIIVIGFILIIFLTFIVNIIKEDKYISKTIFNELHDYINYIEEQENYIILKTEELSKEQSKK